MGRVMKWCGVIALVLMLTAALVWKGYDIFSPKNAKLMVPVSASVSSESVDTAPTVEATTLTEERTLIEVPYLDQNAYPTGCESVSAVMLLRYWGVDITVDTFIDNYLRCEEMYYRDGVLVGPSPDDAFVGNPRTTYGYGCNINPIGLACYKLLGEDFLVLNRTGHDLSELTERYIDHDIPVLIWGTINMVEPYPSDIWISELDGSEVQWIANEHCLVLVGYDEESYYCNDPYDNNGVVAYPRALFEQRYEQMGKQALVIHPADA